MGQTEQMSLPGLTPQWTLGDRLRKAREIAGLSQGEMADAIGIARNSVGRYESGAYDPSRPVLIAWAFRTGVSLNWIMDVPDEGLPRVDSNHQPAGMWGEPPSTAEIVAHTKPIPDLRQRIRRGPQAVTP